MEAKQPNTSTKPNGKKKPQFDEINLAATKTYNQLANESYLIISSYDRTA
jgi:hypothetical protein